VLFPQLRDIRHDYTHNFEGMAAEPVPLEVLLATRKRMLRELQAGLDDSERRFLLSLVAGELDWSLMDIAHLELCRAFVGSCTTWRSCGRLTARSLPGRPTC